MRQDIQPGFICRLDLTSLMPFDNSLLRIKLTGKQLTGYNPGKETLIYGGVRKKEGHFILLDTEQPVEPDKTYRVLINSFLYNVSPELKAADPNPEQVDASWRAPIIKWLVAHPTSMEKPLETLVDRKPRAE